MTLEIGSVGLGRTGIEIATNPRVNAQAILSLISRQETEFASRVRITSFDQVIERFR
jgi:hypothetical protein